MAPVDLILLGQGPSMYDCPIDNGVETWTTISTLSKKGWANHKYTKAFIFDKVDYKTDEKIGIQMALLKRARGDPMEIVGHEIYTKERTVEYPLEEIIREFDTYYWKNDMSYMIAYAILLGYKHLSIWGVDQGGGESFYEMARPYVMFWLGIASGRGVEWDLAPTSILLRDN